MSAADVVPQGDLALLADPLARELLNSSIPARLGYVGLNGTPRVTPMWFTWNGGKLVLGAAGSSPKVAALRANPQVAVTIDSETAPYKVLTIRGDTTVAIVDGAVEEYADSALRYMGPLEGARFRDHVKATMRNMARITVVPHWVSLIDFKTRYPSSYEEEG